MNPFKAILKNRHFRHLWLAQITSQIALNMLTFVLGLQVYTQTRSTSAVSLMLLAMNLPSIFIGLVAGSLVDFFDKRIVLLICNVSRLVLFLLFILFFNKMYILYLLAVIISVITQFFIPAEGPSIPSLVKSRHLMSANSLFTISFYFSTVFGFITAGPLVRILGFQGSYAVMALLMFAAVYCVVLLPSIRIRASHKSITMVDVFKSISAGLIYIQSRVRVRDCLLLMTFSQAVLVTLVVLAPGFADHILGIELTDTSFLVMGPAALGLVFGAFVVGRWGNRFLRGTWIRIGIFSMAAILISLSMAGVRLMPFQTALIMTSFGLLVLLGFAVSLISVPANTILQEDSDRQMRGRVYGVLTMFTGAASLLPVVISGVLADTLGIGQTVLLLGIGILIIGWYAGIHRGSPHGNLLDSFLKP